MKTCFPVGCIDLERNKCHKSTSSWIDAGYLLLWCKDGLENQRQVIVLVLLVTKYPTCQNQTDDSITRCPRGITKALHCSICNFHRSFDAYKQVLKLIRCQKEIHFRVSFSRQTSDAQTTPTSSFSMHVFTCNLQHYAQSTLVIHCNFTTLICKWL